MELRNWSIRRVTRFAQVQGKSVRDTLTQYQVHPEKLGNTLADVMTKALIDALAETVAEVEAEKLSDTVGDVKAEALLHSLADTFAGSRLRHFARH